MGSRHDLGVRLTHCVHSLSIMTYYKHQLSDVFSRYEAACDWYNALGFTYAKTRYGLYKRHFETFASSAVSGKEIPELLEFKKSFDNAYLEARSSALIQIMIKREIFYLSCPLPLAFFTPDTMSH